MGNSNAKEAAAPPSGIDACPVMNQQDKPVYNVYGERINDPNAITSKNPLMALKAR